MKSVLQIMRMLLTFAGIVFASSIPAKSAPGDIDQTFDVALGSDISAIAIQPDGRILFGGRITSVEGVPREGLVRLFPDWSTDLNFDPAYSLNQIGIRIVFVDGIKIQPDGKILASGWFLSNYGQPSLELIRFHPDGTYDSSFQMPQVGSVNSFALLPNGKVLVAGDFWVGNAYQRLIRLNIDGSVDSGFQSISDSFVNTLVVQDDGKVLVGGGFTSIGGLAQANLARLMADGSVDTGFTPTIGGSVATVAVQHDRSILVAEGTTTGKVLIKKYSNSGSLDTAFSTTLDGRLGASLEDMVIQADGKILISGQFETVNAVARSGIARLLPSGSTDPGFISPNSSYFTGSRMVSQPDGRILFGGSFSYWGNILTGSPIRLQNNPGDAFLSFGSGLVHWKTSGATPVIEKINFDYHDAATGQWVPFGTPVRTVDGWSVNTSGLSAAGTIRATGVASSHRDCHALTRKMISFGGAQPTLNIADGSGASLANSSGVDLGSALAGYSESTEFVIRNSGPGALTGISFSFSGSHASQFSAVQTSTAPLGPGEEATFFVRFSPTGTGSRTANLAITHDAAGVPFTLHLSGTGSSSLDPHFKNANHIPIRTPQFSSTGRIFGNLSLGFEPSPGTVLTVIQQTHYDPDPFSFADLQDGSIVTATFNGISYEFIAGYQGKAPFVPFTSYPADMTLTLIGPGVPRSDFITIAGADANVIAVSESGRIAFLNSGSQLRLTLADGKELTSFSPTFRKSGIVRSVTRILSCPDSTFLVAGSFDEVDGSTRNSLAKFDWNGKLIESFLPDIGTDEGIGSVAVQDDGKILVSGGDTFTSVLRLNADGSRDIGFSVTANSSTNLLAPLANGKILMAGQYLGTVNGVPTGKLVRLNTDGSLDPTFEFSSDSSGTVGVVAEQADGKLVISDGAGVSNARLRRVLLDGSMDPGFEPDFGSNAGADFRSAVIQADGKILVGGQFAEAGGESRSFMVRLNPDGSLDPGFVTNGVISTVLVLGRDGGILTNGSKIAGVIQNGMAKLRNNPGHTTLAHPDPSTIRLESQGTAPLVRTSFAILPSGASNWISLPPPSRTATGWEITGLSLPASGLIRSRSIPSYQSTSSSVIEQFLAFGPALPEITLQGPSGTELRSGGSFEFGPVLTGYSRTVKFRVTNHGDGFWDHFGVSFMGQNAGSFGLVSMPDYGLLPGESGIIEISASPANSGLHSATLVLSGNDPANNPLSISLSCQGGDMMSPMFSDVEDVALRSATFAAGGRQFGSLNLGFQPLVRTILRVVDNTGSGAISGTFSDLPDGGVISGTWDGLVYHFIAGYGGGDGNDLVLNLIGPGVVDPYGPANLFSANSASLSFSVPLSDGSTLLGGNFTRISGIAVSHLARIHPDGSLDSSFKPAPNQTVTTVHSFEDGSLIFAGDFTAVGTQSRTRIARLKRDGSLDPAFTPSVNNRIEVIKVQPDGRILIAGRFTSVNGVTRNRIARLLPDGSLDTLFNPNVNSTVRAISLQENGQILIGGAFTAVGGTNRPRIARLGGNGVLDGGFAPVFTFGTGTEFEVRAVHVQSNGAILIGSSFTKVNDVTSEHLCRLLPTGEVDPTFLGRTNATVTAIHPLANGEILIGGGFNKVNGIAKSGVALLNQDGMINELFNSDVTATSVSQIAVRANGAIDVVGSLSSANGVARNGYARLTNENHTEEFSVPAPGTLRWTRGGRISNESGVAYEQYDPTSGMWSPLASAQRTPSAWEANAPNLPNPAVLRARTTIANATATYQLVRSSAVIGTGPAALAIRNPDLSLLPHPSVEFGSLPLGWSTGRSLVLTNDGFSKLASISCSVTGPHSSDFAVVQAPTGSLAPGSSARLEVRFSPISAGPREARLTISSSNPGIDSLVIMLSGQGGTVFSPVFGSATDVPVSGASVNVSGVTFGGLQLEFAPRPGTVLEALRQTGSSAFSANLTGLADQNDVTASFGGNTYHFTATYSGGDSNDLAFVLKSPGSADPEFMVGTNHTVTAIARPMDGSTILAGSFTQCGGVPVTRIARLRPDGTVDPFFKPALSSAPSSISLQRDGRLLVTATTTASNGTRRNNLARIHPDGTLDTSFNPLVNQTVHSAIELRNGRILIGGTFTSVGGVSRFGLARLNADGSLDTGFTATLSGTYRHVYALAEQADGKILIGGSFSGVNGINRGLLARLESAGALDTGFDAGLAQQGSNLTGLVSLLCQPNGQILAGGVLTSSGHSPSLPLIRLETNGQRDPTFAPALSTYPESILLQRDGKIVIGGAFTSAEDFPRNGMARILANGTLDADFQPSPVFSGVGSIKCLADDSEGRLLAGGSFMSMGGLGRANFSRLAPSAGATAPATNGPSRVEWYRSEASTELEEVQFEVSTDSGVHWVSLGSGTRHPLGWEIDGLSLPVSGHLRVTGRQLASRPGNAVVRLTSLFGRLPSGMESWREQWFGDDLNQGKGASTSDPDMDGLQNLLEFSFGLDPLKQDAADVPVWSRVGSAYEFQFERPQGVSGIEYRGEWSESLSVGQWHPADVLSEGATLRFQVPIADKKHLFFRLRVTEP